MSHPVRPQHYYSDPWLDELNGWDDIDGPIPAWALTQGGPLQKNGKRRPAFIWPRDKGRTNSPPVSWRRWKDVLTGKGADIFIGREGSLQPHRPLWSNWTDADPWGRTLDNLGYRDNRTPLIRLGAGNDQTKKYDFRTRKYRTPRMGMWSDVKWERRRHPQNAHYHRDATGVEVFDRTRGDWRMLENPFRYNPDTRHMDWGRPKPDSYYYGQYEPNASPWD